MNKCDLFYLIINFYFFYLFLPLLDTMNLSDHFLALLVFIPGATNFPVNDFGHFFRPILECHSHPQCGWSTGFIFTHNTFGFLHNRLCLPAFHITIFLCCSLPTSHIVAQQFSLNFLTSPDGNFTKTSHCNASFHDIVAKVQADLISFPFDRGVISKLNIFTHSGISFSFFLFQAFISEFSQLITVSQTVIPFRAKTYLFSPSA
jgi:hypothetical protein